MFYVLHFTNISRTLSHVSVMCTVYLVWGTDRGERAFPTVPGNTSLPFPSPKVENAILQSCSRSQKLGIQFPSPVNVPEDQIEFASLESLENII